MVYPQAAYLLREHLVATNWSLDNHYHALTLSSRNLLDFPVPPGLHLSLSHRPTSLLASSLQLSTLAPSGSTNYNTYAQANAPVLGPSVNPLLSGQLGYFFSSAPLGHQSTKRVQHKQAQVTPANVDEGNLQLVIDEQPVDLQHNEGNSQGGFRFRDAVQSFHACDLPTKPRTRVTNPNRPTTADFLMYGRLYAPSPRLDALYAHRLAPTVLGLVSLISVPAPIAPPQLSWQPNDEASSITMNAPPTSTTSARLSELEFKLQHDTGKWSTGYSYAVGDGMWGARALYNFGYSGATTSAGTQSSASGSNGATIADSSSPAEAPSSHIRERVVDEEEATSTGLKGRWSAGGELYFSAQERSAGMSTGVRFATIPSHEHGDHASSHPQPPTVMTATLNPFMGQLSLAYAVQTSQVAALASRFDFNTYSYEAELTVGGEWFQTRRHRAKMREVGTTDGGEGGKKEAIKSWDAFGRGMQEDFGREEVSKRSGDDDEVVGVIKARASTNSVSAESMDVGSPLLMLTYPIFFTQDVSLLWEGRLGDFLVSLGVVADLRLAAKSAGRISPIRSIGVGLQYWG
ncbi:BQ2448_559 [Microbotryum intermedium]|uniref:Mitochondrial distribution and morphology protein 10 n=1 Tax=Microbotryum intermedium TaxID=269621 RepID=A0A238FBC2_9BASI|nr:BQ2448_559 [Microbotryum intermedium]